MRIARVAIETFQAIQQADIELGPGLNVIYGPNDHGKSTVAAAIRAALLLPTSSSEAAAYAPWYADAAPRVTLTFVDGENRYWKVAKAFGSNGGAELHYSKDGISFSLECKGRSVDERLRALLAWGIPAPGGKGAPRGLPTSFIASALLAAQSDVDAILTQTLDDDIEGSGKLRLTKALATLAQDPLFKKVLHAAQVEVDACFTATGKRRGGKSSRFTEATNAVKRLQQELTELEQRLAQSALIEESVVDLRQRVASAQESVDEASQKLADTAAAHERGRARAEAVAALDGARSVLAEIDSKVAYVESLALDLQRLETEATQKAESLSGAETAKRSTEAAVRAAEEAHRAATSADGARELELRRAQLAESVAALARTSSEARARLERSTRAVTANGAAAKSKAVVDAAAKGVEKAKRALADVADRLTEGRAVLDRAKQLVSFVRWREAESARSDAERLRAEVASLRAAAEEKERVASDAEASAQAATRAVDARSGQLPSSDGVKAIVALAGKIGLTEAALGGGLSVAVRPRQPVALRASADGKEVAADAALSTTAKIEASREVTLSIGELVEIEVTAGAADRRRELDELRARWRKDVEPALATAGVTTVDALVSAMDQLVLDRSRASDLGMQAQRARDEAMALRDRASSVEQTASAVESKATDVEERRAALGAADLKALESAFAKLGPSKELEAEKAQRLQERSLSELEIECSKAERESLLAVQQHADAEERASEAVARALEESAGIEGDAEKVRADAESALARTAKEEADVSATLRALEAEASRGVEVATQALAHAKEQDQKALQVLEQAKAEAEAARGRLDAHRGKLEEARGAIAQLDRQAALDVVSARSKALEGFPQTNVGEQELLAARQRLDGAQQGLAAAKNELLEKEGALHHVGGNILREECDRTREALSAAEANERNLETDAEAWKLLHETLRAVENEEGAHLGRALAGPVTARFSELTGGRYGSLQLGTDLRAQSLQVTSLEGTPEVLECLSVGTRNQLATLVRLSIAEQLKSAIVLDDQLVHTDGARHAWFRDLLTRASLNVQVIVLTCRAEDYVARDDLATDAPTRDMAGGSVRLVDAARALKRWEPRQRGNAPAAAGPHESGHPT